ncbi:MAG: DNA-processing protein DprA [Ferruginibacter sp.]
MFANNPGCRPSDFVDNNKIANLSEIESIILNSKRVYRMNFLINGTMDFPMRLKDAKEPVELLYYSGNLDYLHSRGIAIVGTRNPTNEGLRITKEITTNLVKDDFTIFSGLATGIDTQAHTSAIEANGRTVAVIGTPLNAVYPKQNEQLQNLISKEHLLISQVPFYKYSLQNYLLNRFFFLERNKTMSALTDATLIVEAGETSGSLTQATAALYQKRKLLIWDACFYNKAITWPQRFLDKGAIRVRNYDDIKMALKQDV